MPLQHCLSQSHGNKSLQTYLKWKENKIHLVKKEQFRRGRSKEKQLEKTVLAIADPTITQEWCLLPLFVCLSFCSVSKAGCLTIYLC